MEGTGKGNGMTGGSGTEDGQEEGHHHRHLVADGIDMAEKDGERELLQILDTVKIRSVCALCVGVYALGGERAPPCSNDGPQDSPNIALKWPNIAQHVLNIA